MTFARYSWATAVATMWWRCASRQFAEMREHLWSLLSQGDNVTGATEARRKTLLIQWSTHACVLLAWELLSRFVVPPQFLPPPSAVVRAFITTTASGELPRQPWQTASVLAVGFSLANAQIGVANVSPAFIETARAFGCNRWQVFQRVVLYAAVPFFIAGVRLDLGRALVGVVVAEMFTALAGLGYMVVFYGNTFRTAELFVPIVVLAALSIAITNVIYRVEHRIAPWRTVQE